ncbi:hypothetical protein Hypma_007935 [Hypsizygus marmoreus]|uniref:Uncharacterized protein n=1 Tax=Hypsizygus marmoreus TaxID=39966 RepID=A0A369K330_HYPMA|nr:hypothetical protein Hypma_007935 [Hypsizygus marmoreus]
MSDSCTYHVPHAAKLGLNFTSRINVLPYIARQCCLYWLFRSPPPLNSTISALPTSIYSGTSTRKRNPRSIAYYH